MRKIVKIEGMSCGHCAMKVKAALQAVAGVSGVAVALAALAASALLLGCAETDVVGKFAKTSFNAILASRVGLSEDGGAWTIASATGDEFSFSDDFSRSGDAASARPDARFSFVAAPFLAAGLDTAKLPPAEGLAYSLEDGRLEMGFELGGDAFSQDAAKSAQAAFAELVRAQRGRIGYHEKLDHYGIKLGNGNMFEWAKDAKKNDKDIVWVLNPEPFIAAGADPAKIAGWAFATVETKDEAGRTIFVEKLLKPFDLE